MNFSYNTIPILVIYARKNLKSFMFINGVVLHHTQVIRMSIYEQMKKIGKKSIINCPHTQHLLCPTKSFKCFYSPNMMKLYSQHRNSMKQTTFQSAFECEDNEFLKKKIPISCLSMNSSNFGWLFPNKQVLFIGLLANKQFPFITIPLGCLSTNMFPSLQLH